MMRTTTIRTGTLSAAAAVLLAVLVALAVASPNPIDCYAQVMLGENEEHFYYMLVRTVAPASYYESSEIVSVCKKRKIDFVLVDEHRLAARLHERDPETLVDTTTQLGVDPFDLQGYLAREDMNFAHASAVGHVAVEDSVLYMMREGRRATLLDSAALLKQVKDFGSHPKVVNELAVYAPREWKIRYAYYLVQSYNGATDCWQKDLVAVRQDKVDLIWKSLAKRNR